MANKLSFSKFKQLLDVKGVPTLLQKKNQQVPYDTLLAELQSVAIPGVSWRMEINTVPLDKDGKMMVLQFFVPLVQFNQKTDMQKVFNKIIELNPTLLIGSFGYADNIKTVFFKHNVLLKNEQDAFDADAFMEIINLSTFTIEKLSADLYEAADASGTPNA